MSQAQIDAVVIPILLGTAHSYLVPGDRGYLLVDAGGPKQWGKLERRLEELGVGVTAVNLIVVTHGHYDHVGSLSEIARRCNADVLAHQAEVSVIRSGRHRLPRGARAVGTFMAGTVGRLIDGRPAFEPYDPEIVVDGDYDLRSLGYPGKVLATPGHSDGSISVVLEWGEALVGDMAFNLPLLSRRTVFPPFADDVPRLLDSWRRVLELPVDRIYPAHGSPFPRQKLEESLAMREGTAM
jgi:glyoxylase-like metal-dependent hydrolase (beta-lactamase superfamily II)